jgi:hypothetical protein
MTNKRDAELAFVRMAQTAASCGLDVAGWALDPGSRSNGIAWSIRTGQGGASDVVGLPPFGHIGRTAAEAERFLLGMAAAFESVAFAQRRKCEHETLMVTTRGEFCVDCGATVKSYE